MREIASVHTVPPTTLKLHERIDKDRLLTAAEEQELGRESIAGNLQARNTLVCHNHRLVLSIVRPYVNSSHFLGKDDLIQEGVIGLIRAAEKFDPARGYRFSTYATAWIHQSIVRALDNKARGVRVPVHVLERHKKLRAAIQKLAGHSGESPSLQALAKYLKVPFELVLKDLTAMKSSESVSLHTPITNGDATGKSTLQDFIADENVVDPTILIEARQELEASYLFFENILKAVKNLSVKNQIRNVRIFRELYENSAEEKKRNLAKVGRDLSVSRESIRKLLQTIFQKLRSQGIKVNRKKLENYRWRTEELEKLTGTSRELNI